VEAHPATRHQVRNAGTKPFQAVEVEVRSPTDAKPLGDAAAEDPRHTTVLLEKSWVKALRTRIAPGDAAPMHGHGERVTVILTGGRMRITGADGQSRETEMAAGDVSLAPPTRHAAANVGSTWHDAITLELLPAAR
jgi:quercetin dioxygenase-like cupin family protein